MADQLKLDDDTLQAIQAFGTPEQKKLAGLTPPEPFGATAIGTPSGTSYSPGSGPTKAKDPYAYAPPSVVPETGQIVSPTLALDTKGDTRTDYEKFRDAVRNGVPQGVKDFDKSLLQAESDHPALNWAVNTVPRVAGIAGGAMFGPVGLGLGLAGAAAPGPKLPPPTGTAPANDNGAPTEIRPLMAPPPVDLPIVQPLPTQQYTTQPNIGGGAGAPANTNGLGSDKALQNAQKDAISGQQALVDKATEQAGAKIQALDFNANVTSAAADAKRIFAWHQKQVDEGIQKEQEDYEKLVQDETSKAAKLGVDPGRVFKNKSTGTWLLMSIGALAGGALSGLHGTPNGFIETLKGVVHDDMEAQNKDIDQAWKRVGGMRTTYENLVRRGVDRRAASNAYLGQILDSTEQEIRARMMKATLPAEKANMEAAIQSLENERTAMDIRMQEYWKAIYERRSAAAAAAAAAAAERRFRHDLELGELKIKAYNAETQRMDATGKADTTSGFTPKELDARFVKTGLDERGNHTGFLAPTGQEGEKARVAYEANQQLIALAQEAKEQRVKLEKLYTYPGGAFYAAVSPEAKALQRTTQKMQSVMRKADEAGALDAGVERAYAPLVGNLDTPLPGVQGKLDDAIGTATMKQQTIEQAKGTQKAVRAVDPETGRAIVVPIGSLTPPPRSGERVDALGRTIGKK